MSQNYDLNLNYNVWVNINVVAKSKIKYEKSGKSPRRKKVGGYVGRV